MFRLSAQLPVLFAQHQSAACRCLPLPVLYLAHAFAALRVPAVIPPRLQVYAAHRHQSEQQFPELDESSAIIHDTPPPPLPPPPLMETMLRAGWSLSAVQA